MYLNYYVIIIFKNYINIFIILKIMSLNNFGYQIIKVLSKGAFANIYLVSNIVTSKKYTAKEIQKKYLSNPKAKKYVDSEISILKDVNHPNIIKLIDIKESSNNVYIITEYCNGGTLEEYLDKYKKFSEEIVQHIMKQVIEAMKYLFNKKIIHRNINLDNILIDYDDENDKNNNNIMKGRIKIMDFGYARYLKKGELAKSVLGSPVFMSPIIINKFNEEPAYKEIEYDEKEDIWSLGIICYVLLIGIFPFDPQSMKELLDEINKGDYFVPTTLSQESISFLNCMLQFDPKKRLSLDKLYKHKFLRRNVNEFNKIDINELKNITILDNSKILINTKDNQNIIDNFGVGIEESIII